MAAAAREQQKLIAALGRHVERIAIETEARDTVIRIAFERGVPAVVIAEAVGMTRQRVYQIARSS